MTLHIVTLKRLVIRLAVGGAIILAASFLFMERKTARPSATEGLNIQSSGLVAPGAGPPLNSTGLRSSATTVPNNKATPDYSRGARGAAQAGIIGSADKSPEDDIAKSSSSEGLREQLEQTALSQALTRLPRLSPIPTGDSPRNLETAVTVPRGEQAPAVFYDNEPRTEPQMIIMDEIAREFNEAIQREVPGYTAEEVWTEARDWADERYMLFFGEEEWSKLHLRAAQDAVTEKEAMGNLPQRTYE